MRLGKLIKRRRKELDMTRQDLADCTPWTKKLIAKVERGQIFVPRVTLEVFAEALETTVDELTDEMTNLDYFRDIEDGLVSFLGCPYLPGEDGAECKTEKEQRYAHIVGGCRECVRGWLNRPRRADWDNAVAEALKEAEEDPQ